MSLKKKRVKSKENKFCYLSNRVLFVKNYADLYISPAELHLETLGNGTGGRIYSRFSFAAGQRHHRALIARSTRIKARARVRDGGAIIKTNIPFRAGLLFDVPDGATSRLSLAKNGRDQARSRRVRRYMQILDRERGCCQQIHCASSRFFFNTKRT